MPSPRTPPLDAFPSSPSSAWSCAGSLNYDQISPLTPDSYFSPVPAIVSTDEHPTLHMPVDVDLVGSQSSFPHLSLIPPPKLDTHFLSTDDTRKAQVFLRNKGRWGDVYNQLESSPPLRPRDAPRVARDDFSWGATHSTLMDASQLPDPSRCSLLIHEVSLLVGLTAEDEHLSPGEPYPSTSKQIHDILPLNLTPTKSLASRKHNPSLPLPTQSSPSGIIPHPNPILHNQGPPPVLATPIPRHKRDAVRPPSPRRRHGQVFQFEPSLGNEPPRSASHMDESFCYPRAPPPKPVPKPLANRCSSLDRLEYSLLKLEAHAPHNHRKSRSEGRSSERIPQRDLKRPHPSPLPPRHLKPQHSNHEIMPRQPSRPAQGGHFSSLLPPPVSRAIPPPQHVAPRPAISLDDDLFEEDITPSSFMDMDIPHTEEAGHKQRTSSRRAKSKEKVKSLVGIAKRVSRGVIAWGKNMTGKAAATAQETTTVQNVRI